jgi:hypothetical protein
MTRQTAIANAITHHLWLMTCVHPPTRSVGTLGPENGSTPNSPAERFSGPMVIDEVSHDDESAKDRSAKALGKAQTTARSGHRSIKEIGPDDQGARKPT